MLVNLCNTTALANTKTTDLEMFGELKLRIDRGDCITSTPLWVEIPSKKYDRKWKVEGKGVTSNDQKRRGTIHNPDPDTQLWMIEK